MKRHAHHPHSGPVSDSADVEETTAFIRSVEVDAGHVSPKSHVSTAKASLTTKRQWDAVSVASAIALCVAVFNSSASLYIIVAREVFGMAPLAFLLPPRCTQHSPLPSDLAAEQTALSGQLRKENADSVPTVSHTPPGTSLTNINEGGDAAAAAAAPVAAAAAAPVAAAAAASFRSASAVAADAGAAEENSNAVDGSEADQATYPACLHNGAQWPPLSDVVGRDLLRAAAVILEENTVKRDGLKYTGKMGYMIPAFSCPEEERIGPWNHEGHWLCMGSKILNKDSVVYSIGHTGRLEWEKDLHATFGVQTTVVDNGLTPAMLNEFSTLDYIRLDSSENGLSAFQEDVKAGKYVDVVKLSCLGCELDLLAEFFLDRPPTDRPLFGQILVDFTRWSEVPFQEFNQQRIDGMERAGYYLFHAERRFDCSACYKASFVHYSLLYPADCPLGSAKPNPSP